MKFNGEQHAPLTPGEYTQLTGRAGRRGIDVEGHAVVLWHPDVEPADVAGLASTRTFPLRSSFAPSYNMTINLIHQMGPEQSRRLLERSFAQYQADRSVVGLVKGVARGEKMLDEIAAKFGGRDAPILEYARLRAEISNANAPSRARHGCSGARRPTMRWPRCGAGTSSRSARAATVGLAVVLEPAADGDDPRPLVLNEHRWAGRISSADYAGASAQARVDDVAQAGRAPATPGAPRRRVGAAVGGGRPRRPVDQVADAATGRRSRTSIPSWPRCANGCAPIPPTTPPTARRWCEPPSVPAHRARQRTDREEGCGRDEFACADLRPNRRAAHRARLHHRRRRRSEGDRGRSSARADLQRERPAGRRVPARAARGTVWTPRNWRPSCRRSCSNPGATRRARAPTVDVASGAVRRAYAQTRRLWTEIRADEQRHRVSPSREPDPGFIAAIHRWATSGDLASALAASDATGSGSPLSAGDFVRWCRQVLDMLDQVRNAAPTPGVEDDCETRDQRHSTRRRRS